MKTNIKIIIAFIFGIILATSILVGASLLYKASDIEFHPTNSDWNVSDVESALNDINDSYLPIDNFVLDLVYKGASYDVFTAPIAGKYKIELWGAQGGTYNDSHQGGKGAYTKGVLSLEAKDTLYIYIGGQGGSNNTVTNIGGYNGGGYSGNNSGGKSMGGGGATDVRYFGSYTPSSAELVWSSTLGLRSRIMVAAGGGGAVYSSAYTNIAGYAGGLKGGDASGTFNAVKPTGATQTSTGASQDTSRAGKFGYAPQSNLDGWGGGGGSGWYAGSTGYGQPGPGGSSFISGYVGCNAINADGTHRGTPIHYSEKVFEASEMLDGSQNLPSPTNNSTIEGNTGHGHARITLIQKL